MAIVLPHRRAIVVPAPREELAALLSDVFVTYRLSLPDGDVMVLPHGNDSLRMLDNMGINTEGCDVFDWYYDPPRNGDKTLWWWQMNTARFLTKNPRAFVTSTPRTGKTLATLTAIDFVLTHRRGSALIVAPLTVANGGEWEQTVKAWFPHRRVQLIHKDRADEVQRPADIYLINPDGAKLVTDALAERADRGEFSVVVIDELTEYANPRSDRWRAVNRIIRNIPYRWGLTGTPGTPDKIYGQVKLINPNNVPKYFTRWREMTEVKVSQFKWVPKRGHEDVVKEAMSPCIRYDKEQLMTIPTPTVEHVSVPLTPEQSKASVQLAELMRTIIGDKEINASSVAIKLLQVSGGVVRDDDGNLVPVPCAPKLAKMMELIRRTPRKKVVFGSFVAVNDMLVEHIREQGYTCEKIDGSVTGGKRSQILRDFMESEEPHVLVCHPRTAAYGIELASADMIICYGPPISGSFIYQQLFERLSSVRQQAEETFVVHLSAGEQDKHAFDALSRGVNVSRNIVNIFTEVIDDILGG